MTYNVGNASFDPYPGGPIVFSPDSTLLAVPLSNDRSNVDRPAPKRRPPS
jgi:hypothetical protein